jgi:dihydrofolate reductase
MIYAQSPDGIIGVGNAIPWRHPGDLRRFKRVTLGTTVVMGRKTFESMGKPLPGRRNVVVTRSPIGVAGVECVRTLQEALALAGPADVWFVGGARVYEEAMRYVDVIDVTYVPDRVQGPDAVHAPVIDETLFAPGPLLPHEDEPALSRRIFTRRLQAE